MNVTTLPATPFIDASATFTLVRVTPSQAENAAQACMPPPLLRFFDCYAQTRFPPPAPSTAPPVSTAAPSTKPAAPPTTGAPATSAPVATTPAPVVPSPPPVTNKIDVRRLSLRCLHAPGLAHACTWCPQSAAAPAAHAAGPAAHWRGLMGPGPALQQRLIRGNLHVQAIINGVDNLPLDVGNAGVAVANHIVG